MGETQANEFLHFPLFPRRLQGRVRTVLGSPGYLPAHPEMVAMDRSSLLNRSNKILHDLVLAELISHYHLHLVALMKFIQCLEGSLLSLPIPHYSRRKFPSPRILLSSLPFPTPPFRFQIWHHFLPETLSSSLRLGML